MFFQIGSKILDAIFPAHCCSCGRCGTIICDSCLSRLVFLPTRINRRTFAAAPYSTAAEKIIHHWKYKNAAALTPLIASFLIRTIEFFRADIDPNPLIIPVPVWISKIRDRGFHHTKDLAHAVGKHFFWSVSDTTLVKIKKTKAQVNCSLSERRQNVRGSFQLRESAKGKSIVLIDDILTTGSTLKECQTILSQGRPKKIVSIVFASGKIKL